MIVHDSDSSLVELVCRVIKVAGTGIVRAGRDD